MFFRYLPKILRANDHPSVQTLSVMRANPEHPCCPSSSCPHCVYLLSKAQFYAQKCLKRSRDFAVAPPPDECVFPLTPPYALSVWHCSLYMTAKINILYVGREMLHKFGNILCDKAVNYFHFLSPLPDDAVQLQADQVRWRSRFRRAEFGRRDLNSSNIGCCNNLHIRHPSGPRSNRIDRFLQEDADVLGLRGGGDGDGGAGPGAAVGGRAGGRRTRIKCQLSVFQFLSRSRSLSSKLALGCRQSDSVEAQGKESFIFFNRHSVADRAANKSDLVGTQDSYETEDWSLGRP